MEKAGIMLKHSHQLQGRNLILEASPTARYLGWKLGGVVQVHLGYLRMSGRMGRSCADLSSQSYSTTLVEVVSSNCLDMPIKDEMGCQKHVVGEFVALASKACCTTVIGIDPNWRPREKIRYPDWLHRKPIVQAQHPGQGLEYYDLRLC